MSTFLRALTIEFRWRFSSHDWLGQEIEPVQIGLKALHDCEDFYLDMSFINTALHFTVVDHAPGLPTLLCSADSGEGALLAPGSR